MSGDACSACFSKLTEHYNSFSVIPDIEKTVVSAAAGEDKVEISDFLPQVSLNTFICSFI